VSGLAPRITVLQAGTILFRVVRTQRGIDGALHFGPNAGFPPASRFDSPSGAFRVCYLAESREGAFAESMLRLAMPRDPASGVRLVALRALNERSWMQTTTRRALRLADLCGPGLANVGETGALTMSVDHVAARELSEQVHALKPAFDGLRFRLRHDPDEIGVALFDRAAKSLRVVTALTPLTTELRTLGAILDRYGVGVDT
jgi:hypothetical protein